MIKDHNFAILKDQNGANDVEFEVNWDPKYRELVKLSFAGKSSTIKKDDLWNFIFTIVKKAQQHKMVPVIKDEMIRYTKQHEIELQRDMKKGEIVVAHCKVNVKQEIDDAIRREIEEEKQLSTKSPYVDNQENSVQ